MYLPRVTLWFNIIGVVAAITFVLLIGGLIPYLVMVGVWVQDPTRPDDASAHVKKYGDETDILIIVVYIGLALSAICTTVGPALHHKKR